MNRISFSVGIILLIMGIAIAPCFNAQIATILISINDECRYSYKNISKDVVWDNGMHYDGAQPSQRDESYPFEAILADDFQFETETIITDIHWIGAYIHNIDGDFDMEIVFYNDRGDGNAPGDIYSGPFYFLNKEVNETRIALGFWYDYHVTLPETIMILGEQKFWISIQSVGIVPPQWGLAFHDASILLHEAVWKSEYLGFPEWTDTSIVMGRAIDVCFQLIKSENKPPDPPIIDGPSRGKPGIEYCWIFNSTNSGNNLYYIDWGDGNFVDWAGPSEFPIEKCHAYPETGTYIIRAKIKDIYGDESD